MRVVRGFVAIVGSIIVLTATSACASEGTPPDRRETTPNSVDDRVEQFTGFEADYDPLSSPAALAETSQLVVTGTIDRVQDGRVQIVPKNESEPGVPTVVLVLRDVQAVAGSLDGGTDGFVYVELPYPGQHDVEAYLDGFRTGSDVVAYLVPASDGLPQEGVDVAIADPQAGRPDGQALYIPAGPQALVLQHKDEAVVWPLIGERRDGRIDDALPGGTLIAP